MYEAGNNAETASCHEELIEQGDNTYVGLWVWVVQLKHWICPPGLAAKLPPTLGPFRTRSNPTLAQP